MPMEYVHPQYTPVVLDAQCRFELLMAVKHPLKVSLEHCDSSILEEFIGILAYPLAISGSFQQRLHGDTKKNASLSLLVGIEYPS